MRVSDRAVVRSRLMDSSPPIAAGSARRKKVGSGRLGVRKNAKKKWPERQSAALEALARMRIEHLAVAERMRVCAMAKLTTCGWDGDAQLDENGGIHVARVPGAY
jgi:hypothetical protein